MCPWGGGRGTREGQGLHVTKWNTKQAAHFLGASSPKLSFLCASPFPNASLLSQPPCLPWGVWQHFGVLHITQPCPSSWAGSLHTAQPQGPQHLQPLSFAGYHLLSDLKLNNQKHIRWVAGRDTWLFTRNIPLNLTQNVRMPLPAPRFPFSEGKLISLWLQTMFILSGSVANAFGKSWFTWCLLAWCIQIHPIRVPSLRHNGFWRAP